MLRNRKKTRKLLNFFKKLFNQSLMHIIPDNEKPLHSTVVNESYKTYTPVTSQGMQVTPNPMVSNKRFVGGENNKIFPDIIVWRPNTNQSSGGTAVLVEQIETPSSINIGTNLENWRKLDSLNNVDFTLVIPSENLTSVRDLLRQYSITPDKLQTYEYDQTRNGYIFRDQRIG